MAEGYLRNVAGDEFEAMSAGIEPVFSVIYSVKTDGSNLGVLLNDNTVGIMDTDPFIVADRIVFASNRDMPHTNAFDIYAMNLNGTGIIRLTVNSLCDNLGDGFLQQQFEESTAGTAKNQATSRRLGYRLSLFAEKTDVALLKRSCSQCPVRHLLDGASMLG